MTLLKSITVSLLSLSALSAQAAQGGLDLSGLTEEFRIDPANINPADQELVNRFQRWAMNPDTNQTMVAIPPTDNGTFGGNGQILTQEIVNKYTINAAVQLGYALPLNAIKQHSIRTGLGSMTVERFMKSGPELIDDVAKGDPNKREALIYAQTVLKATEAGLTPVEARVLGPAKDVSIDKEFNSEWYCRNVPCNVKRKKITIRIFASVVQKLIDSKVVGPEAAQRLTALTTKNYYFVNKNGVDLLEEVPYFGIKIVRTVLSH